MFQIKKVRETDEYGEFVIEPLAQGYGQTLGNSLRRVLLSSLPGAAITSVKIEGVRHQFTTIPGLKEDVVDFILNLKKVRLLIEGSEKVNCKLNKKGPGEICARDISVPAGVKIVNPDHVLGTLADKKSHIDMQIIAERGYGYLPQEEQNIEEVGVITVDALFSPVYRVNYHVEATRVGRRTDFDKLVIEIFTDKTIKPLAAMKEAAKILSSYFQQIYKPKKIEEKKDDEKEKAVSEEVLNMRIEEFDIPTRIVNALAKGSIEVIKQLVATPRSELLKIKNLGSKSMSIIEAQLKEKGIALLE